MTFPCRSAWCLQSLTPQTSFLLLWSPLTRLPRSMGPQQGIPWRLASPTHASGRCLRPLQRAARGHHGGLRGIFWDLSLGRRDRARPELAGWGPPASQRSLRCGAHASVGDCIHGFPTRGHAELCLPGAGSCHAVPERAPSTRSAAEPCGSRPCCSGATAGDFRVERGGDTCNSPSACSPPCASPMAARASCTRAVWAIRNLPGSGSHPSELPLSHVAPRDTPLQPDSARQPGSLRPPPPRSGGLRTEMNPQCCQRQSHKPQLDFVGQKMSYLHWCTQLLRVPQYDQSLCPTQGTETGGFFFTAKRLNTAGFLSRHTGHKKLLIFP